MDIYANNVIAEDDDDVEVIGGSGADYDVIEVDKLKKRSSRSKSSSEVLKLNADSKHGFIRNIQHNSDKKLLKTLGFGVLGALTYPLVPTVVQAVTKRDMSGWVGMLAGVGTASLLGLGLGKPELAVGAISAMGTHLLYSKGTKVIEDLTNTQIYRMNPQSVVYTAADVVTQS